MTYTTILEKILRTLTEDFNYVVCSIEESKDIDTLSIDELQSSLLVHEQKMNKSSSKEDQALKLLPIPNLITSQEGVEEEVKLEEEEIMVLGIW